MVKNALRDAMPRDTMQSLLIAVGEKVMTATTFFKTSERFASPGVNRSNLAKVWASLMQSLAECPADMSFEFRKPDDMAENNLRARVSKEGKKLGVKFRVIKHEQPSGDIYEIGRVGVK